MTSTRPPMLAADHLRELTRVVPEQLRLLTSEGGAA